MSGFKLIGIRPHKDCGEKYLKVLEPGRLYQFYNEYEFYTDDGKFDGVNGEITHYKFNKTVPENLYQVGNLNVNISAVVGKNGTGKSSLIELLLYAIYIISVNLKDKRTNKPILQKYSELLKLELEDAEKKQKKNEEEIEKNQKSLIDINEDVSNFLIEKNQIKSKVDDILEVLKTLNYDTPNLKRRIRNLKIEIVLNDESLSEFRCSLFYVCEDFLYELSLGNQISLYRINSTKKELCNTIDLNLHFFYSTILNYSHHALNSNHIGYWINSLFHKNDGYKTPAVINPMRDEGNFDINNEIDLSKSRLLVNSLFNQLYDLENLVPISDKQFIHSIYIKRKDNSTFNKSVSLKLNDSESLYKISGHIVGLNTITHILNTNELNEIVENGYSGKLNQIVEDLLNYLVNKVHRIQKNYSEYFDKADSSGLEDADQIVDDIKTINKLNSDFSHVSFKYHRSIYYLQKIVSGEFDNFLKDVEEKKSCSLRDYLFKIGFLNEENEILDDNIFQIFLRVPPPIFDVDINISNSPDSKNTFCKISDLSSGEQQNIHTINTFIYHLNNAYSVHKESVGKRQKYQYFNAVFDEIELYFHPDYQRRFIKDLLRNIEINKHLIKGDFIKGINLIFSTHSPFILSDIPRQNILKLEFDEIKNYSLPESMERQTFGANIHDLLSNSFFLGDSYKGEFANNYFKEVINKLNSINSNNMNHATYEKLKRKIDLIAEPFIKSKLFEILDSKFEDILDPLNKKIERMQDEIERLKREKEEKQKKRKNDTD